VWWVGVGGFFGSTGSRTTRRDSLAIGAFIEEGQRLGAGEIVLGKALLEGWES